MIPWEYLDGARVPGGDGELGLYQRGAEFSIRVAGRELMNSRIHGSEEALAELAFSRVADRPLPRILIGGLGMGFTLRAALDALPAAARVDVAEIMPSVVKWNRGPLAVLAGHPLDDKRVEVREVNAARMVREAKGRYHAILLDVDNGPAGLSRTGNHWFYGLSGLDAMFSALRPDGVLALWSAGHDIEFTQRMEKVGFQVEAIRVRARAGKKGAHHVIWIATKKSSPDPRIRS